MQILGPEKIVKCVDEKKKQKNVLKNRPLQHPSQKHYTGRLQKLSVMIEMPKISSLKRGKMIFEYLCQ